MLEEYKELISLKGELKALKKKIKELEQKIGTAAHVESDGERLTYDYCFCGEHCWEIRGTKHLICSDVCEAQGAEGCKNCPIKKAIDKLAYYEELEEKGELKPVVHAHWIKSIFGEAKCSKCHDTSPDNYENSLELDFYCPYCGAKMDERSDKK